MTTIANTAARPVSTDHLGPATLAARMFVLVVRVVVVSLVVLCAALAAQSLAAGDVGHAGSPTPGRVTTPHPMPAGY